MSINWDQERDGNPPPFEARNAFARYVQGPRLDPKPRALNGFLVGPSPKEYVEHQQKLEKKKKKKQEQQQAASGGDSNTATTEQKQTSSSTADDASLAAAAAAAANTTSYLKAFDIKTVELTSPAFHDLPSAPTTKSFNVVQVNTDIWNMFWANFFDHEEANSAGMNHVNAEGRPGALRAIMLRCTLQQRRVVPNESFEMNEETNQIGNEAQQQQERPSAATFSPSDMQLLKAIVFEQASSCGPVERFNAFTNEAGLEIFVQFTTISAAKMFAASCHTWRGTPISLAAAENQEKNEENRTTEERAAILGGVYKFLTNPSGAFRFASVVPVFMPAQGLVGGAHAGGRANKRGISNQHQNKESPSFPGVRFVLSPAVTSAQILANQQQQQQNDDGDQPQQSSIVDGIQLGSQFLTALFEGAADAMSCVREPLVPPPSVASSAAAEEGTVDFVQPSSPTTPKDPNKGYSKQFVIRFSETKSAQNMLHLLQYPLRTIFGLDFHYAEQQVKAAATTTNAAAESSEEKTQTTTSTTSSDAAAAESSATTSNENEQSEQNE